MPDAPQAQQGTNNRRVKRNRISRLVAIQALNTLTLPILRDDGMVIVDGAVEEVEEVSEEGGCEGHDAPVLG